MKKVYLAHPISTTGEFNDSIRVAKRIEGIYKRTERYAERTEGICKTSARYVVGIDDKPKYQVYAPALNKAINDKSNNPTPQMIYEQDVERLLDSDIVVVNYTGGDADGTVLELGILSGLALGLDLLIENKMKFYGDRETVLVTMSEFKYDTGSKLTENEVESIHHLILEDSALRYIRSLPKVLIYSSNKRALQPQLHNGIASGKLNHMVLGAIDKYFNWFESEDDVIEYLKK